MQYRDSNTGEKLSKKDVSNRAYPSNLPNDLAPEKLRVYHVEPVRETERPTHEPWQTVREVDPADTDGDGVREQQWVIESRPLTEVRKQRIDALYRKRDQKMAQAALHTLSDGTTVAIPVATAAQTTRMLAMYVRAQEARQAGEDKTFVMTGADGSMYRLTPAQMAEIGTEAIDLGQKFEEATQRHVEALMKLSSPQAAWEYDDDLENDGWPTSV